MFFSNMFLGLGHYIVLSDGYYRMWAEACRKSLFSSIVGRHVDVCWCIGDNATTCVTTRELAAICEWEAFFNVPP